MKTRTLKEIAGEIFEKLSDSSLTTKQQQEIMMDIGSIAMKSAIAGADEDLSDVDELTEYTKVFAKQYVEDSDDPIIKLIGKLL